MRVVLLTDCLPPVRNGVAHHVQLLWRDLVAAGVTVHVIAPGPAAQLFALQKSQHGCVRYAGLPIGSTGYHVGWPLKRAVWDVLDRADILHAHHPFLSGSIALHASARSGIPIIFTSHTRYDLYLSAYAPWLPHRPAQRMLLMGVRRFADRCAAVVAPSTGTAALLESWGVRAPIELIPNGIEIGPFQHVAKDHSLRNRVRMTLGLPPDAVVALYVGRLSTEKRVHALLASFAAVRQAGGDCRLLLVGAGSQSADVRAAVARLGVSEWVVMAGERSYAEIPQMMAAADFFASASLSESHPLTFLEAAAAGLPALGFDSPGIADIVRDGETGLLAPAPDSGSDHPLQLDAGFVCRWLALAGNAMLRSRLGNAAAIAAQAWQAERTAGEVLELYRRILRRG